MPPLQLLTYGLYAILILVFVLLSSFAIFHAFKYSYISSRTRFITWVYILVSSALIGASVYFLLHIRF